MKRLLTIALLACAVLTASADDEPFVLRNGNATMTVDPAKGGKILSLQYQDTEVFSQSRWPESFGSTFWTSPQKEWNWPPVPEYDKMPYTVVERGEGKLAINSQVSERLKYQIGKEFSVDDKSHAIVINYTIRNEASEARQVAPWEITRVTNDGGIIFFDAPIDGIAPTGLMNFKEQYGAAWYQTDAANENRKINADGHGWLAYCNKGLLLVKQFEDLDASAPAPGEAEIQVYVNRGKTYIELESQGAYTKLEPGQQLSWTVRWYLVPVTDEAQPSAKLTKMIKKVLKK